MSVFFFQFVSPHLKPRELFRPIFILLNEDTKHKCKVDCHRENWKRTNSFVHCLYIPLSSSLMKYLTLPFPSSTLLALDRKVNYSQMYTPNLPTPINNFCLAAVILLMWLRAYHTVKFLESGEFAPLTNLWKNDWVNLKIIWKEGVINKVLSRKVLTKLITSPGAVYFSTKKKRNVK